MGSWWFKKTDMVAEPSPTAPYLTIGVDTADGKLKSKTSAGVLTAYLDTSTPLVPPSRIINTTTPLLGGGVLSNDLTLILGAATPVLPGSMSAVDKAKLDAIVKAITATATALTTVESVVLQLSIPANSLHVGSIFRYFMSVHPAISTITTTRIRVGPAGTIADPSVVVMSATASANPGSRVIYGVSGVNVIGASATHIGVGCEDVGVLSSTGVASVPIGTFNSTVANFVSVTIQNTISTTTTIFGGVLEIL